MPETGSAEHHVLAPQSGMALILRNGQKLRVIDVEGKQVADLVAFSKNDPQEMLSTAVTIDMIGSLMIAVGSFLYSNRYNPMLKVLEDTVGRHDILHPACSPPMYRRQYGIEGPHPSCQQNLADALCRHGIIEPIPTPLNIFMNTSILKDGSIRIEEPLSAAGDFIEFGAEMDLIVGLAACSVEESSCNAYRCKPIEVQILP